jgi:hypothetical protein
MSALGKNATWLNDDGLVVGFGPRSSANQYPGKIQGNGAAKALEFEIAYNSLPDNVNGDGGMNYIPANSSIISCTLVGQTAWTDLTDFDLGLQQMDGTEIDNDGLIASEAAITAGEVVTGAGALIGTTIGAADGYLTATAANATAGTATVRIVYVE